MKQYPIRRDESGNLIPTRPMLQKEFTALYNIRRRPFLNQLALSEEPIGPLRGHYYTIRQGALILKCMGEPAIKID
jgi:hypothetical protein